jgi:hypothetical protein
MKYVTIKLRNGMIVKARSYGYGWVTVNGDFIHRSKASVIECNDPN